MLLQSMARVETDPRIVFTFANVVFKGMASWPQCHIVNNTSYAILERVKYERFAFINLSKAMEEGSERDVTLPLAG
jgi:hypothetical protein